MALSGPAEYDFMPRIGIEFDTLEDGIEFYRIYAISCGFDVRKFSQRRSLKLLPAPSSHVNASLTIKHRKFESLLSTVNKLIKGKLRILGAKSVKGGVDKVFNIVFSVRQAGEQVLKASQCCLYTTAGPIQGRVFITTHKLAFCSHYPVAKVSSPDGASLGFHYKIERMNKSKSMKKPSQKYMQVVTTDEYEFWFTGFRSYNNTLKCLQQAISQTLV
ncbi:hypothetical protein RND81_09G076000 [Saponaria officinalis]|uniref:GRAM domain-containing protein n=1 Tax=Saponaria officinalis TaxID=3572 RepID=A0AAW1IK02_SAPOF